MPRLPALPKLLNRKPHIERRIHRALEERRSKRGKPTEPAIYLSEIGSCPRNLWGSLHGIPRREPEGRALVIFHLGDAIEAHLIELLRAAGFMVSDRDENGQQHHVVAHDGRVRGRLDGRILLGEKPSWEESVLEIKSAKASKYEELEAVGYEAWNAEYADTLHSYMGYSGLRSGLALVECKDDSRIYAEKIAFDSARFSALDQKVESVLSAETVVPRPAKATGPSSNFCKWCPRNEWCWSPLAEAGFDA